MSHSLLHLKTLQHIFIVIIVAFLLMNSSCNEKEPFEAPFENVGGWVIGKETCHADESLDYWLIDFTYRPNTPKVGDTLVLNGETYTNVLKVKGLGERLRQVGMAVSIDYKTISSTKVITTGCTVPNPVIYPLKELFILYQFEIRG